MTVRAVGGLGSSACRRNDEDDARDTFKFLKSQRIGDKFAILYTAWARFEAEAGNADKVSFRGDAKSSLGGAKCSLGDAKSSLGDAESSLGDAKSSLGDADSSLG